MMQVSEVQKTAPSAFQTELQQKVYETLETLGIPFERVDTEEAITMEDCIAIDARLDMKTVKTLFLCNRQQTEFYLFVMPGEKTFRTKDFSKAMGISRVSFAPQERMEELLGTRIGATTVFSCLLERSRNVHIVFDKEVLREEWYGCSDGTITGYMKLRTEDLCRKVLPYAGREAVYLDVPCQEA